MNRTFYSRDANPHVRRLEELGHAQTCWQESEWLLNFLRTQSAEPIKQPTDEELLLWMNPR